MCRFIGYGFQAAKSVIGGKEIREQLLDREGFGKFSLVWGSKIQLNQAYRHFGSTTQYNMNRKTIRFILAVSAEHRRYNNTLYNIFYYIQICGVRTRTELSDSLHRILSEQRPEKTCRKKTSVRKKTRQEIWVGSMAHALKSPSYEGYTAGRSLPLFTKQVFQQRTANSK